MKAKVEVNELRLGNLLKCKVSNDAAFYRVAALDWMGQNVMLDGARYITWYSADKIKPIPLTPEILEKCGFVKVQGKEDIYRLGQIQLYHGLKTTMCYARYDANEYCYLGLSITSLHQLQNLFFSLTQTELNVEI